MSDAKIYSNPDFPFGAFTREPKLTPERRTEWREMLKVYPKKLSLAIADLEPGQLAMCYRRWTVTQIVHHVADAQLNWFMRFKQALTTLRPTIIPFDETIWSQLADSLAADCRPSLDIIAGINQRWYELCLYMPDEDYSRVMFHPERQEDISLDLALAMSTWHGYHHLAQIQWLKQTAFQSQQ
ncbi:MAG: putative metal-dependent hydrolase [Planctomycetaceae bacterium]|nr:putative metal-dependent hydrolase [Planctomycetaceae bacterium]